MIAIAAAADLPTKYGRFRVHVFHDDGGRTDHVAIVHGDVWGAERVPVRIHTACLLGDVFGSYQCDCGEQMRRALELIGREPRGIVIYLRDAEGSSVANQVRAVHALRACDDEHNHGVAASILRSMGVRSIALPGDDLDRVRQVAELEMAESK